MTRKRPGLKKRAPRSAPMAAKPAQRTLPTVPFTTGLQFDAILASLPVRPPSWADRLAASIQQRVRSFGSACLRFRFRWWWA